MRDQPGYIELIANGFLANETIVRTETVRDVMFNGMDIQGILDVLLRLNPNATFPDAFEGGRFGLYRGVC